MPSKGFIALNIIVWAIMILVIGLVLRGSDCFDKIFFILLGGFVFSVVVVGIAVLQRPENKD